MSHGWGAVRFSDGVILFYEYDGTAGIVMPTLYRSYQELQDNWRKGGWPRCACKRFESVEVYSDYGSYWSGWACRHCLVIVHPLDADDIEIEDAPEWVIWLTSELSGHRVLTGEGIVSPP